jgi:hypothetical protein
MDLDELAKRTLERTWDLHQQIYRFLDESVEQVRSQFEPKEYDPWYFTHAVRYQVCRSIDAIPEALRGFTRTPFPMSGLEVLYREFKVKIWKVNGGEMPIAGQSAGREEFLEQRQPMLDQYLESLDEKDLIPLKLFISWDVNKDLHLKNVKLVCPKTFESAWRPGEDYFAIPIPHPATGVVAPTEFTEEPGELDVPLQRKKAAENDGNSEN